MIWENEIYILFLVPGMQCSFCLKHTAAEQNEGLASYIIHGLWCIDFAAAFVAWGHGNVQ